MKHRVLFLCIGNSCRSPIAEAFARAYGHDIIEPVSAGLSPANFVDPNTKAVMAERGISLDDAFPKPIDMALKPPPNLIVNISGQALPYHAAHLPVEIWQVRDPVGEAQGVHREIRDEIEGLVMKLILRLRTQSTTPMRTNTSPAAKAPRYKFGRMA
jgi:arsenate reductase (thioredoxin)